MSIIVTFFVIIINFLNCLKRSKYRLPILLIILLLLVLMGASTQNPDINAYLIAYNTKRQGLDFGYSFLQELFFNFGFDYYFFRFSISLFGILLIHQTVKKFIINKSAFYLLYFLYPFIIDVVQIRNFLIMSILIFSVPYLITGKIQDKLKYIICILVASSLQLTAVFYLPLVFIEWMKKKNFFKILIIVAIVSTIVISINKPLLSEISKLVMLYFGEFDQRVLFYTEVQTNLGFLLLWFLQFANWFLITWANRIFQGIKCVQNEEKDGMNLKLSIKTEGNYLEIVKWINIFAFFFLPFYVFQITFARLLRNIIPLNIIAFLIVEQKLWEKKSKNILFTLSYLGFQILLILVDLNLLYANINIFEIFMSNGLF